MRGGGRTIARSGATKCSGAAAGSIGAEAAMATVAEAQAAAPRQPGSQQRGFGASGEVAWWHGMSMSIMDIAVPGGALSALGSIAADTANPWTRNSSPVIA